MSRRPVILAVTMGDAGGIGPEIALKAVYGHRWPSDLRFVVLGSMPVARQIARRFRFPLPVEIASLDRPLTAKVSLYDSRPGGRLVVAARAAVAWIRAAAGACLSGRLDGMVTAPISKEGLWRAGLASIGHTELLAELAGTRRFGMMLMGGGLKVVLATRHIPLASVPRKLRAETIIDAAELASEALAWFGERGGTVGVCALNPHAGDGGAIGTEEQRVILPALKRLKRRGVKVEGPVPADVIFYRALRGDYGAVVALYHDQGLGPLKMLAFETGVNVTLGLPFVRTSPDHGTAFDIAGKGIANASSMVEAIRVAYRLARRPNPWRP